MNFCLAGSVVGLAALWSGAPGVMHSAQQQSPIVEAVKPATPPRPAVQPLIGQRHVIPSQAAATEGDGVVPPMIRKRPPPAKTSVPIVAPPAKKAAAKAKVIPTAKGPVATKGPVAAKGAPAAAKRAPNAITKTKAVTPPPRKSGLGVKIAPGVKCNPGLKYDAKQLRCVKSGPTPVAAPAPALAKTKAKQ